MRRAEPHNLEAEQSVLGSLLIEPSVVEAAFRLLTPGDFYLTAHRLLFETMLTLHQRGSPIELLTVEDALREKPLPSELLPVAKSAAALEFVGGLTYLQNLMEAPASAANLPHYAQIVQRDATRREIMRRAVEVHRIARREEDALERIAEHNGYYHLSDLARVSDDTAINAVSLEDVEATKVDWLWLGYIPFGMITLLQGDPGLGKGTLSADLAARLSRGCPMPNLESDRAPMTTLLVTTAEDDLARTIKPRLMAAEADMRYVRAIEELLAFPEDTPRLEKAIRETGARLLIIDPLNAYLSGKVDSHKDQDIRRAISPIKQMAERTGVAVLLIHHLNKMSSVGQALHRASGSIAIPGAARSVLMVGKHPHEENLRVLAPVKQNLSAAPPALTYTIEAESVTLPGTGERIGAPRIQWVGTTDATADELLSQPRREKEEGGSALEKAIRFYREALANGERPSAEVEEEREDAGIATRTAKRARERLGVRSFQRGRQWFVSLQESERQPEGTECQDAGTLKTWHSGTLTPDEIGNAPENEIETPQSARVPIDIVLEGNGILTPHLDVDAWMEGAPNDAPDDFNIAD